MSRSPMEFPDSRLFQLHFNTGDLHTAETALQAAGLPLQRKFGFVDGGLQALDPDEPVPPTWRFYVEVLQRGYTNITLGPGGRFRFDHLGIVTTQFDEVLDRAESLDWTVQYPDGRRTFLHTPWGFRIEIHPEGNDVESELGSWQTCHLTELVLLAENTPEMQNDLQTLLGEVPGLRIKEAPVDRPAVEQFSFDGDAFGEPVTVPVSTLREERND